MICEYGCGEKATCQFLNGRWCCSGNVSQCLGVKKTLSLENKSRSPKGCIQKGFKQPRKECPNCLKLVSNGNYKKHVLWCSGNGANKKKCVVCGSQFYSYTANKTCSSKCAKKQQSSYMKEAYHHGLIKPYGGSGCRKVYFSKVHGRIELQSSYEWLACTILDRWLEHDRIIRWEYTKDRFSYFDENGDIRTYFPDFKVWKKNGSVYYIETKGFRRVRDDYKWNAVRKQGFKIEVWLKEDLTGHMDNKDL